MGARLVDLGFIGGAEVDRFGNLNTFVRRLGRAADRAPARQRRRGRHACMAKRLVAIIPHERRRFRDRVDYITSPGFGDGPGWRARNGIGGGPSALITTLGVFRDEPETCQAILVSYHPGNSVEEIRQRTSDDLAVAPDVQPTPEPTPEELAIIRRYDPTGFWTGGEGAP